MKRLRKNDNIPGQDGDLKSFSSAIENSYKAMSLKDMALYKPKSRLESFLRRKILEEKRI